MVENYTKDIKESIYHGAIISALAVGYTVLGNKTNNLILNLTPENVTQHSRTE